MPSRKSALDKTIKQRESEKVPIEAELREELSFSSSASLPHRASASTRSTQQQQRGLISMTSANTTFHSGGNSNFCERSFLDPIWWWRKWFWGGLLRRISISAIFCCCCEIINNIGQQQQVRIGKGKTKGAEGQSQSFLFSLPKPFLRIVRKKGKCRSGPPSTEEKKNF